MHTSLNLCCLVNPLICRECARQEIYCLDHMKLADHSKYIKMIESLGANYRCGRCRILRTDSGGPR